MNVAVLARVEGVGLHLDVEVGVAGCAAEPQPLAGFDARRDGDLDGAAVGEGDVLPAAEGRLGEGKPQDLGGLRSLARSPGARRLRSGPRALPAVPAEEFGDDLVERKAVRVGRRPAPTGAGPGSSPSPLRF